MYSLQNIIDFHRSFQKTKIDFLFIWVFFHEHSRITCPFVILFSRTAIIRCNICDWDSNYNYESSLTHHFSTIKSSKRIFFYRHFTVEKKTSQENERKYSLPFRSLLHFGFTFLSIIYGQKWKPCANKCLLYKLPWTLIKIVKFHSQPIINTLYIGNGNVCFDYPESLNYVRDLLRGDFLYIALSLK